MACGTGVGGHPVSLAHAQPSILPTLGEQLLGGAKRGRAARRVAGAGVGPYYIAFVAGSCLYRAARGRRAGVNLKDWKRRDRRCRGCLRFQD